MADIEYNGAIAKMHVMHGLATWKGKTKYLKRKSKMAEIKNGTIIKLIEK